MPTYYDSVNAPENPISRSQLEVLRQQEEATKAARSETQRIEHGENIFKAIEEETFFHNAATRFFERRSRAKESAQEGFTLTEEMRDEALAGYSGDELEYLKEATSAEEFKARKVDIEDDKKRGALAAEGGIVANLVTSLFDPTGFTLGAATGGLGWVAKGGTVSRIAKGALVNGITEAGMESVIVASNTQSEATDLILAFAAGAGLGGLAGAIPPRARGSEVFADRLDDDLASALDKDATDHILSELEANKASLAKGGDTPISTPIERYQPGQDVDRVRMEREVLAYEQNLSDLSESGLSHIDKKRVDGQRKALMEELEAENNRRTVFNEDTFKKSEALRAAEAKRVELKASGATDASLKEFDGKIAKMRKNLQASNNANRHNAERMSKLLQGRIDELNSRVEKSKNAKKAAKDLRQWRTLTLDQKIKKLYPEGTAPKKEEVLKEEIKGFQGPQSAGAAANPNAREEQMFEVDRSVSQKLEGYAQIGAKIPTMLIGSLPFGKKVANYIQGAHARLTNSDSMAVRGLVYELLEAGQGGPARKDTASVLSKVFDRNIRGAMRGRWSQGLREYAEAQGKNPVLVDLSPVEIEAFNRKVIQEVVKPGSFQDAGIKKAASGVRDQLKKAGKIRKTEGEVGFDNIDLDENYFPVIHMDTAIRASVQKYGVSRVRSVIEQAYMKGGVPLDQETASDLADAFIARAGKNTMSVKDAYRQTTGKDIEELAEGLRKAGVKDEIIDDFLQSSAKGEAQKHMSDRAKISLKPDISVREGDLSFLDMIDTNIHRQLDAYTLDSSGGAAMARFGFKSRQEFTDTLAGLEQSLKNKGEMSDADIEFEVKMLDDTVTQIYGRSVSDQASTDIGRFFSRARSLVGLVRLNTVGLATMPEGARTITNRGLKAYLRQIPSAMTMFRSGRFNTNSRGQRVGGKIDGEFTDARLRSHDRVINYAGEDHVLWSQHMRSDEIEEAYGVSTLGAKFDNWLATGRRVQEVTSFFRTFQGGGEKISFRALMDEITSTVYSKGRKSKLSQTEINDAGWSDGFLDRLKKYAQDNRATDTMPDGRLIEVLDYDNMPEDMFEQLQVGVTRLTYREMQRAFAGETSTWMGGFVGQNLTQFRAFSIMSLDKQLIHDFRHDRWAGAMGLMWSAGLSTMAYGIHTLLSNDEERIRNMFEPQELFWGTFTRMGQLASTGIAVDVLATLGAIPDSQMAAPGRGGARTLGINSVPVLGYAADLLKAGGTTGDAVFGNMGDAIFGEGEEDPAGLDDVLRVWGKVLPWAKSVGMKQTLDALEGAVE